MRQDAGAIASVGARVESTSGKSANAIKTLGAASAVAGKLLVLGIGGAMAVSAKAAIEFESSMAGVAKTTDLAGNSFDRNSGPLFAFGQALRNMSLRVPINVNELAKVAELGGQLGIETPNLIAFTEVMTQLGVATNMTAEEAATGFARFANIMRTPQDEFERLGSTVVELGNNLATTESEILRFALRIGPVARTVNATEEEVFALSGALSSLGIPAERGGTAVQKWMILAKEAVEGGGASLEQFAEVAGMTADEFADLFRKSPVAAFNAFAGGLDRINKSGGDLFGTLRALELGEVRTTQVLLAAAGGVEVLDDALRMANEAGAEGTALQEEAARRYGTTASQIAILGNAFTDLKIEIGNAFLSSGGLAFGLDVMGEFFRIIKDNLPLLGKLVTVAGMLVAVRLGLYFAQAAQSAQEGIKRFIGAATAVENMTKTARLAQGGMLLLTGAMQAAIGIAGALATVWLLMAVNAAQARAEARQLNEEIASGVDPMEALAAQFSEHDRLTRYTKALHGLGLTMNDLAEYMISANPEATLFGRTLSRLEDEANAGGEGWEHARTRVDALQRAIQHAQPIVDGFMDFKRTELRDALLESGLAAGKTRIEMDALVDSALRAFGLDLDKEGFISALRDSPILLDEISNRAGQMSLHFRAGQKDMQEAIEETGKSWEKFLDPETAEDTIENFMDANIAAVEDFNKEMKRQFDAVGDTIRDGFPVWEEYKQVVLGATDAPISFQAAIAAQEAFLEDTRDFVERMPSIMDMGASSDTVNWLDSLAGPIKGAIGRLNDAQLVELIAGANRNFDELNRLHNERWMQIYPDNAKLAFAAMIGELTSRVDEMNLPGEYATEAFFDGLMDMAATLPEENRDEFMGFVQELMDQGEIPYQDGWDATSQFIKGMAAGFATMASMVIPKIEDETQKIKNYVEGTWGIRSPSKWWMNLGEKMTLGLAEGAKGMTNVFVPYTPDKLMPEMVAGVGTMSNVTNNRSSTYSLTVNGAGGNNLNSEAQTLLTLLTIVGGVEAGAGK